MALTNADFIFPVGELQASMFPGQVLTTLIDAWIAQAVTKVAGLSPLVQDTAATHWVYFRAYSAIAKRIGVNPTRESFGGNSGGGVQSTVDWGQNKSTYWEELAQKALDNFNSYVPAEPPKEPGWSFHVF